MGIGWRAAAQGFIGVGLCAGTYFIGAPSRSAGGASGDAFFDTSGIGALELRQDIAGLSPPARLGLEQILNGAAFDVRLPRRLYTLTEDIEDTRALWAKYGFFPDVALGRHAPLAQSTLTDGEGHESVAPNCFMCHATVAAGRVVFGAGNSQVDFAAFASRLSEGRQRSQTWPARLFTAIAFSSGQQRDIDKYMYNARYVIGSAAYAEARGENFGPYIDWLMAARMASPESLGFREKLEGVRDEYDERLAQAGPFPPVDPNPWWHIKYRRGFYYWYREPLSDGTSRGEKFAFNFQVPWEDSQNVTYAARITSTNQIFDFIDALEPPSYPGAIDERLAAEGARVYADAGCADCHGTYRHTDLGLQVVLPEAGALQADVGTDCAYSQFLADAAPVLERVDRVAEYPPFRRQGIHQAGIAAPAPEDVGQYGCPVLVGVWASAPYFHNGSVPNLRAVLDSRQRPVRWQRALNPHLYDFDRVGLSFREIDAPRLAELKVAAQAQDDVFAAERLELRLVYDTTSRGRSNSGHDFGDDLTPGERDALLEYLKTLQD